jgi:hypothetical protein
MIGMEHILHYEFFQGDVVFKFLKIKDCGDEPFKAMICKLADLLHTAALLEEL